VSDTREGVRRAIDQMADACHNATEWNQFPQLGEAYLNPALNAVWVEARAEGAAVERAKWVAVVEGAMIRGRNVDLYSAGRNAVLTDLLTQLKEPTDG
jgi:hypothetical protein